LVIERSLLDIWLLVTGFWLLDTIPDFGYWKLINRY